MSLALNSDQADIGTANATAAAIFRMVADLEPQTASVAHFLKAILLIMESSEDSDSAGPVSHLCRLGLVDVADIERARGEIFHVTHRFAYPERAVAP